MAVVEKFSIFDSRFSIGRFRAGLEFKHERKLAIENRESKIENYD